MQPSLRCTTYALLASLLPSFTAQAQEQNALDFDGVDDEVTVDNGSAFIAGASGFSLSCWVDSSEGLGHNGILGLRDEIGADFYLLRLDNTNSVEGRFRNSDGTAFSLDFTGLAYDTWQHLAMVYNGSELILYHNGVEVSSVAASGGITSTSGTFRIGNLVYSGDDFSFSGQLDEVGFWSTALTEQQVQCLASSSIDETTPGLELYYNMDQGVAGGNNTAITTLTDQIGNADGTLQGFGLTGATSNFIAGPVIGFPVEGSLCEGGSYTFNGQELTTTGTYTATFTSSSGCDSTVVLTLVESEVNTNVAQNGNTLISTATGAAWQWVDCNNANAPIPGATGQYYTATAVGSYGVLVTQNGCTEMSDCRSVTTIGIEEAELPLFTLSPVPASDVLTIDLERPAQNATLAIVDMTGRELVKRNVTGIKARMDVSALAQGAYFVRLQADGLTRVVRFVRE